MTTIPDTELLKHASRARDKVVLITGAAGGIGKEAALLFAKHGAHVVIGDIDEKGVQTTVKLLNEYKHKDHIGVRCDVTNWDDQVAMFEAAFTKWGHIDVVIPNAGISEAGNLGTLVVQNGRPLPPNLKTADINLTGVLYTVHLGIPYLQRNAEKGALRSIILLGSMASWQATAGGPLYSATKHSMLGLMRALHVDLRPHGIRVGIIHPWFAETNIITPEWKDYLTGIPLTPVSRVAAAIVYASTDPDTRTAGYVWMLPDDQPLLRIGREQLTEGVYRLINDKLRERIKTSQGQLGKAKL